MKRISLVALFALMAALVWPSAGGAQAIPTPPPTPTPDPMVYRDAAMNFHAPVGFVPMAQRHVDVSTLGENPTPLAAWLYPNRDHPRRLILQAQAFTGSVSDFDSTFEQQMRSQFDGALFKNKQNFAFKNGMPAMFMEMTSGEGFNVQKFYIVIWAD
ncbi:MAG TPA: hypothetical protein VIK27_08735, partial [Candidatus Aquilonibacter sp.]